MASSENFLPSFSDPWALRPAFQDPWISDALSKALLPDSLSSFLDSISAQSPPLSGVSDTPPPPPPPPKRPRPSIPAAAGKASNKRKSRASKRNHTTFITAEPANFRHMVQQVTGFRFGSSPVQIVPPVLKPEPHRPAPPRLSAGLPTLDTSALLLHHHTSRSGSDISGPGQLEFSPGLPYPDPAPEFDTFSSFPTLESWKPVL